MPKTLFADEKVGMMMKSIADAYVRQFCGAVFVLCFHNNTVQHEACATSQNRRKKKKTQEEKKKLAWMCRYMRRIQIKKSDLNRRGSGLVARDLTFIFFFSTKLADEVGH